MLSSVKHLGVPLAVFVLALASCGEDDRERSNRDSEVAQGSWEVLPEGPRGVGRGPVFRLGRELVVVTGGGDETARGAAFDLASETWRRLPDAPLPWRADYTAIKGGPEVIVWGGSSGARGAEGARYNHRSDSWRPMASSPLDLRAGHTAVWSGDEMLVWGGETRGICGGPTPTSGAAYDPATDSWRRLAKAPVTGRLHHSAVWTGDEMLVWGGMRDRDGSCEPRGFFTDGAAYDPRTDGWRRIASAPIGSRADPDAVWTGAEMLVWNGARSAAYHPGSDRWRLIPKPPLEPRRDEAVVWTGRQFIVWGGGDPEGMGHGIQDGASYDPEANRWTTLPAAPTSDVLGYHAIWTKESMFILGPGCCGWEQRTPGGLKYRNGDPPNVKAG